MGVNSKHVKSSGLGKTGQLKKDGYAAKSVPQQSLGWKRGTPYTGPNVATGDHKTGGD